MVDGSAQHVQTAAAAGIQGVHGVAGAVEHRHRPVGELLDDERSETGRMYRGEVMGSPLCCPSRLVDEPAPLAA